MRLIELLSQKWNIAVRGEESTKNDEHKTVIGIRILFIYMEEVCPTMIGMLIN